MNSICIDFRSERVYPQKTRTTSYENDETFLSLISKSQQSTETDYDFSDMYVRTYQHSAEDAVKDISAVSKPWKNTDYMQVPATGDLTELMDSIEEGIADGKSLRDILQDRIDRYAKECGEAGAVAVGSVDADLILVDPETGKVIDSMPKGRVIILSDEMDYYTVKSQADDLATFLRYTVFKKETDDPEKVSALISELKEKQSDYDTSRFLPIFYSGGKQGKKNLEYWLNLLGDDWGDDFGKGKSDKSAYQLTDELMEIIKMRYSYDDNKNENLLEEIKEMKLKTNIGY